MKDELIALGLKVRSSSLIPDGFVIWFRDSNVVGIWKAEIEDVRAQFFKKFGLRREAPQGANAVGLSPSDYAALIAKESEHGKDQ